MSVSQVISTPVFNTGSAARTVTPEASTAVGEKMTLIIAFQDSSATAISGLTGWTVEKNAVQTGTLKTSVYTRVMQAGDTSWTFTPSQSVETLHLVITGKGADASTWAIGGDGTRAASGGTNATTAPSITTTLPNARVFIVATERTTANETVEATVNNGFTKILHTFLNGSSAESMFIGFKDIPTPGAVGATTVTFQNSQATNGYATMFALAEAGQFTGAFASSVTAATSATGRLGLTGSFATVVNAVSAFGAPKKLRVFGAQMTSPPEPPKVRLYAASSPGTELVIPKVRIYAASLAGSPLVVLNPLTDRTENPERHVTLQATMQGGGFADSYTWRRVSGTAVTLSVDNDTVSFTVPSIPAPGAVQIGCRATVNGVQSPEVVATITIIPQTVFSRIAGRAWTGALTP